MEEALRPKNFYLNSKAAAASDLRLIPICAYAIACKIRFVEFRKIFINFGAFIKIYKIQSESQLLHCVDNFQKFANATHRKCPS